MAPSYTIPALARSFEVIECISKNPDGTAFTEIVAKTGAPKSSIFRILHTLEANSWVEKKDDRYFLGYMLIHYGLITLSGRRIADVAKPVLEKLMQETGETSHLAVPSGKNTMILDVCESNKHIKLTSTAGKLLPLHCTSHGKLFLAHIVKDDLEGFYYGETLEKRTEYTITDLGQLKKELEKIRRQGHALDNQEFHENVRCCAAPIFGSNGLCIGAIGVTGTTMTCTPERLDDIARSVKNAAEMISRQMGRINN
jgi:DNA-binding IclR family transcriptional regulator